MTEPANSDTRDRELAKILDQLISPNPGDRPTLEELAAAHPHLAGELKMLWGTALVVDAVARHAQGETLPQATQLPATDLRPPAQLGDFELCEELGRGGMGVVYRARQRSLDRAVAVKLILQGTQASEVEKARFRAEVAAAARLEHPHIVPIYQVDEAEGWQFFAMKIIDGNTLADRIAKGPVPEQVAVEWMIDITHAIEYAHQRGVIHRDLKPANILIDREGVPHVTDFGLAKYAPAGTPSLTHSGTILGTPAYMAPEQAAGNRGTLGPQSDVYSLGALLYSLLTGRAPFQGATPVDTLLMVLEQDPLPPRLLNRLVDRDLEMIVLKCLQKPAELRYNSAKALAEDLQAYSRGESITARRGRLTDVLARVFRETHHAAVLENWGVLWMWHAAVLLVMCLLTNAMFLARHQWPVAAQPWPYLFLWAGGLAVWAPIFWALRHRAGPVTTVERQVAHAWGGSIAGVILLFGIEGCLALPVLTLSPVLGLIGGMVFTVKAGILAGSFYFHAAAMFATSVAMAVMQRHGSDYGVTIFGLVAALTFFVPGWKYHRQSKRKTLIG